MRSAVSTMDREARASRGDGVFWLCRASEAPLQGMNQEPPAIRIENPARFRQAHLSGFTLHL